MKSNVMPSIVQIERENLKELMTEVKETLATNYATKVVNTKNRSFGLTDLWNCHRKRVTARSLRRN